LSVGYCRPKFNFSHNLLKEFLFFYLSAAKIYGIGLPVFKPPQNHLTCFFMRFPWQKNGNEAFDKIASHVTSVRHVV